MNASIGLRTPAASRRPTRGHGGPGQRPERPPVARVVVAVAAGPFGALVDPGPQRSRPARRSAARPLGGMTRSSSWPEVKLHDQALAALARDDAGPLSPPLKASALRSSRRPPFCLSGPWQARQCVAEDRPDLAVEVDAPVGARGRAPACTARRQSGTSAPGRIAASGDSADRSMGGTAAIQHSVAAPGHASDPQDCSSFRRRPSSASRHLLPRRHRIRVVA